MAVQRPYRRVLRIRKHIAAGRRDGGLSNNSNGQNGGARWAGVVVTVVLAAGIDDHPVGRGDRNSSRWRSGSTVHRRRPALIQTRYAEMEHQIWFLEGKAPGSLQLTATRPCRRREVGREGTIAALADAGSA